MTTEDESIEYNGMRIHMPDSLLREQQVKDSQAIEIIAHKVSRLSTDMAGMAASQQRMSESITTLVRIEERQIIASVRLDDLAKASSEKEIRLRSLEIAMPENIDKRISAIESKMPGLSESRLWIVGGILAVLGLVGTAIIKVVFK